MTLAQSFPLKTAGMTSQFGNPYREMPVRTAGTCLISEHTL